MNQMVDSDDEEESVHKAQDSDDDDDDNVDIGFRRHHYSTFDDDSNVNNNQRPPRSKEEAIYGVFWEESHGDDDDGAPRGLGSSRSSSRGRRTGTDGPASAPMFVAAKKPEQQPPSAPVFTKASSSETSSKQDNNKEGQNEQEKQPEPTKTPEELEEERQEREKQKAADDYFNSLLQKAKGKRRKLEEDKNENSKTSVPTSFGKAAPAPMSQRQQQQPMQIDPNIGKWEKHTKGIGMKLLAKMGYKGSGGLGSNRLKRKPALNAANSSTLPAAATDGASGTEPSATSNEASHQPAEETEGTAKKGISRPIEVVVRPANMGLGFGTFKEQSQLKVNRQIEAEVRGIELPDNDKKKGRKRRNRDDDEEEDDLDWGGPATKSSALPSTKELLAQKSWKRGSGKARKQRQKPKVIPYTELLKQTTQEDGPVIVDMRGPTTSSSVEEVSSLDGAGKIPLAEELLHNVSFLLNTYENKIHSSSHFLKSTERKVDSLKSDVQDMERQKKEGLERIQKLDRVLEILDRVEALAQSSDVDNLSTKKVGSLLQELEEAFSPEERKSLRFWEVLAPALVSPIVQQHLETWDPLGDIDMSEQVIGTVFDLCSSKSSGAHTHVAVNGMCIAIFQQQLLPRVKKVLESTRWNPATDTDSALDLYEALINKVSTVSDRQATPDFSSRQMADSSSVFVAEDNDGGPTNVLIELVRREIMLDVIHPKIVRALTQWKPSFDGSSGTRLQARLDRWILPWIVHLDHEGILPNLMSDCRRKLKSALTYLHRKIGDDFDFLRSCIKVLKPWERAFRGETIHKLVSANITPRLARFIGALRIRSDVQKQDWSGIELICDLLGDGLLSSVEFLSIVESEVMTNVAITVHEKLSVGESGSIGEVTSLYTSWRSKMLTLRPDNSEVSTKATETLRADDQICSIFYSIARMIQVAQSQEQEVSLSDMRPSRSNYQVSLSRRMKEKQQENEDDLLRMESSKGGSELEARIRLQHRNTHAATFRDVVEEFARENNVLFQPRMGANSTKDGKPVFLYGDVPIYLDSDIVFAYTKDNEWRPVSLEQLAGMTN